MGVLTTPELDAISIDPSTARFGPSGTEAAPLRWAAEDVDGDGDLDVVFHFSMPDTGITCGQTQASLTGRTGSGQAVLGIDSIKTTGC